MRCSPGGAIAALRFKVDLPNYGVFDEKRVFAPGPMPGPILSSGVRIGIPICEDIWGAEVVECLSETGGEILLVPNGSPYWRGKTEHRLNIAVARVVETGLPLIYLNQVGGQDELVFDGASFVLNADRSARRAAADLPRERGADRMEARRRRLALRRRPDGSGRTRTTRPITAPACWACATTSTRTASRAWCSACPAASTPRCAPRWRSMRWAPSACAASCCPIATPRRTRSTMRPTCAKALGVQYDIVPIESAVLGLEKALAPLFDGAAARRHRGEPPGARPRHHPDGDLQQVRPDGGDDRQQVGDVGRLRHALRRHERRLQSDQGSLQDRGLPAVAAAQRAGSRRARSGRTAR